MLIYIEKGSVNKIPLTLWESVTLAAPYFIFQFTNRSTEAVNIFTAPSVQLTDSYTLFDITEQPTGLDAMAGIVSLPSGQWKGEIYESATESLDPDDWSTKLKECMVIVEGEDITINQIYR